MRQTRAREYNRDRRGCSCFHSRRGPSAIQVGTPLIARRRGRNGHAEPIKDERDGFRGPQATVSCAPLRPSRAIRVPPDKPANSLVTARRVVELVCLGGGGRLTRDCEFHEPPGGGVDGYAYYDEPRAATEECAVFSREETRALRADSRPANGASLASVRLMCRSSVTARSYCSSIAR